tara:strand:+ start:217 stop:534 length:318 start_codon:yes stop_codon:yes gene_type:complete
MESSYYSKEMNEVYGLKLKEFKVKLEESNSADNDYQFVAWVHGLFNDSDQSRSLGWAVSFNHEADDTLYHLLNDKGNERVFKTVDSSVKFLSELGITTGTNISWC